MSVVDREEVGLTCGAIQDRLTGKQENIDAVASGRAPLCPQNGQKWGKCPKGKGAGRRRCRHPLGAPAPPSSLGEKLSSQAGLAHAGGASEDHDASALHGCDRSLEFTSATNQGRGLLPDTNAI